MEPQATAAADATSAAPRIPVKSKPTRQPVKRTYRERNHGQPYAPGMYDHLLGIRAHADEGSIRGVTIELAASGRSVIATELLVGGQAPRHIVSRFPYYVDIRLPDGRSYSVEVREWPADEEERTLVLVDDGPVARVACLYSFVTEGR